MMKLDYLLDVRVFLLFSHAAAKLRTIGKIAIQAGGSVTVPCFYDEWYRDHVKYWCKGDNWYTCKTLVRSDSSQQNAAVSLIDDPANQVFTVTMRNPQTEDSDTYRCIVEMSHFIDIGTKLYLQFTAGAPALSVVNSWINGKERGTVAVTCLYIKKTSTSDETKWCSDQGVCKTASNISDSNNSSLQISDNGMGMFTVTMRRLKTADSGWYWCSHQDLNIPVYICVNRTTMGTDFPNEVMTKSPESRTKTKARGVIETLIAVAVLALLLATVLVFFCIIKWKLKNRQEQIQTPRSQRHEKGLVLPETGHSDWGVLYTTVDHTQRRTEHTDQAIYNNVARPEAAPEAVQELVYSVVIPHRENE